MGGTDLEEMNLGIVRELGVTRVVHQQLLLQHIGTLVHGQHLAVVDAMSDHDPENDEGAMTYI